MFLKASFLGSDTILLASGGIERDGLLNLAFTPSQSSVLLKVVHNGGFGIAGTMEVTLISKDELSWESKNTLLTVCNSELDRYRFGYNGQQKTNEIAGVGNHNTALFWEYDTRIARRWNRDPRQNPSISPYSVFNSNPIFCNDILGDTTKAYTTTGELIGTLNDGLKNQVHFFKLEEGELKAAQDLIKLANEGGVKARNELATLARKRSVAFIGEKSASSLQAIAMKSVKDNKELGFYPEVGADREIIFQELSTPPGANDETTFSMYQAINSQSMEWRNSVLGLGHTHFADYKNMARVNTPFQLLNYYGKPTTYTDDDLLLGNTSVLRDFQRPLPGDRSTPLFIGSPVGLTIYDYKSVSADQQTRLFYGWFK